MLFTVCSRVVSTFKEDLIQAIQERFEDNSVVELGIAPVLSLLYYVVDIVVRHKDGKAAAIFPATSEERALGAVLFAKELELRHIDNVVTFLVFEQMGGSRVGWDTLAKATNSELELATWEGGKLDVIDKIARKIGG